MAVHFCHDIPLLKPFVDCFLVHLYNRMHCNTIQLIWSTFQPLHLHLCSSNAPIICFNTFICIQPRSQPMLKDLNVWPISSRKFPLDPSKVSIQNVNSNLTSECRLHFVFVWCKRRSGVSDATINSIDAQRAIAVCPCPRGLFVLLSKAALTWYRKERYMSFDIEKYE